MRKGRERLAHQSDAGELGRSHTWIEMTARAVQQAETRLRELRHEQWEDVAVAAAAFGFAIAATRFGPALVLPVFLGGAVVAARGVAAFWRRWDLLDRLTQERDAYTIPEVRARAVDAASPANRRLLACAIRRRLEVTEQGRLADELAALAAELEDEELELDPACAAACDRLFGDAWTAVPPEEVRSRIRQIRAGFSPARRRAA
jgi:hypothetical protein